MSTTVQALLDQLATQAQETDWSTGLWSAEELIGYINLVCKDFVLKTQIIKLIDAVAAVSGQRIYDQNSYTSQMDRVAFNNTAMDRTSKFSLDRADIKWRTLSGIPKQYHQDQLPIKQFEVNRAPTSTQVGRGYTASGLYGTLRQMSGAYTYAANLPAGGGGGIFRYAYGARAYNGILPHDRPFAGTLRQMLTGLTNFEVMATRLVDDVAVTTDILRVPDFTVMYVKYGVLAIMFAKEGESQDMLRSQYAAGRYDRGVQLFRKVMGVKTQDEVMARV